MLSFSAASAHVFMSAGCGGDIVALADSIAGIAPKFLPKRVSRVITSRVELAPAGKVLRGITQRDEAVGEHADHPVRRTPDAHDAAHGVARLGGGAGAAAYGRAARRCQRRWGRGGGGQRGGAPRKNERAEATLRAIVVEMRALREAVPPEQWLALTKAWFRMTVALNRPDDLEDMFPELAPQVDPKQGKAVWKKLNQRYPYRNYQQPRLLGPPKVQNNPPNIDAL